MDLAIHGKLDAAHFCRELSMSVAALPTADLEDFLSVRTAHAQEHHKKLTSDCIDSASRPKTANTVSSL